MILIILGSFFESINNNNTVIIMIRIIDNQIIQKIVDCCLNVLKLYLLSYNMDNSAEHNLFAVKLRRDCAQQNFEFRSKKKLLILLGLI